MGAKRQKSSLTSRKIFLKYFGTHDNCVAFLEKFRFVKGEYCFYCNAQAIIKTGPGNRHRYYCNSCRRSFSILAQSPFEDSRRSLKVWLYIIDAAFNDEIEDLNILEVARLLGTNRNSVSKINQRFLQTKSKYRSFYKELAENLYNTAYH